MEEARQTRRAPILIAMAGVILLAAIWATMALAGGSTTAAKPVKQKAAPAQKANGWTAYPTKGAGDHDCPNEQGASNDL